MHAGAGRVAGLRRAGRGSLLLGLAVSGWLLGLFAFAEERAVHRVGMVPSASDAQRQGLVRIANDSEVAGAVTITAIDETGRRFEELTLDIAAGAVAEVTSTDLEGGNPDSGLSGATGPGVGDWWLEIATDLDIQPRAYAARDGFLTPLNDVAPLRGDAYRLVTFNPGRNSDQVGLLRFVNPGPEALTVTIRGADDRGISPGDDVTVSLSAGTARTYTAAELESGAGADATGAMGSGFGKWRLDVDSAQPILAMSLLANPNGHLTNLSAVSSDKSDGVHVVSLFPAAWDEFGRQGFVRVVNHSGEAGEVRIEAFDETGWEYEALVLTLAAGHTAHFNSDDLETGNPDKGLAGSTGSGEGDWRLALTSPLDIEVFSYIRTRPGGFVTAMYDTAPRQEGAGLTYYVPVFQPAAHTGQASWLRLTNLGDVEAEVSVRAVDDDGEASPEGDVGLALAAGETRILTAEQLEQGGEGLDNRLGTGSGRWRLYVSATQRLRVINLGHDPVGPLANLSRGRPSAVGGGPDLTVESILASDANPAAGETLSLSATVRNQGSRASATTTLRYHLSDDAVISDTDTAAGTDVVRALATLESSNRMIDVIAPEKPGEHFYGACVDEVADESDTGNNCSTGIRVTVPAPPSPDLVVTSVSVSDTGPEPATSLTLSATVYNRGPGDSSATTLRYYRSANGTISTADTEIGSDSVERLAATDSSAKSIAVDAPTVAGSYYYGVCVDPVALESDQANNCSLALLVTVPDPSPDLVVAASVSDTGVLVGGAFTLSATIRNRGSGDSDATTLRYYRSTDATVSTTDVEIGTEGVAGLAVGAASSGSVDATAAMSAGTFYYGACVDAVTRESDTGNNCSSAVRVTVSPLPPDLVVTASTSDHMPDPGSGFTLSATVRNQGTGESSATTLRYYRSTDDTISASDLQVGSEAVVRLMPGGSASLSATLTAPTDPGDYHYGACVDSVPYESDTANNCSTAARITVPEPPDLVVVEPAASDTILHPDTEFTFSATVRNRGAGESDATTLRYHLSADAMITTTDDELDSDAVDRLGSGAASVQSATLTAPTEPGTYYYGACVDAVAWESDTTNNCSESFEIVVPEPSDLVVSATASDSDLDAGAPFTVSATVRNIGAGASDATTLRYYLSADNVISPEDTEVDKDPVEALDPEARSAQSSSLRAPADAGTYYYGACVDPVVRESDTTNNCSAAIEVEVTSTLGHGVALYRYDFEAPGECSVDKADAWIVVDESSRSMARNAASILCRAEGRTPAHCNRYCVEPPCRGGDHYLLKDFRICAAIYFGQRPDRSSCHVDSRTGYTKDDAESQALAACGRRFGSTARCQIVVSDCNGLQDG